VFSMTQLLAPRRLARSRYFHQEDMNRGMGILMLQAKDFPQDQREALVGEIIAAYEVGQ
jgi:hypothetical protein